MSNGLSASQQPERTRHLYLSENEKSALQMDHMPKDSKIKRKLHRNFQAYGSFPKHNDSSYFLI